MSEEGSFIAPDSDEFEDSAGYSRDYSDDSVDLYALSNLDNDQDDPRTETSIGLEDIRNRLEQSALSARAVRAKTRETKKSYEALLKLEAPSTSSGLKPKKTPARPRSKSATKTPTAIKKKKGVPKSKRVTHIKQRGVHKKKMEGAGQNTVPTNNQPGADPPMDPPGDPGNAGNET